MHEHQILLQILHICGESPVADKLSFLMAGLVIKCLVRFSLNLLTPSQQVLRHEEWLFATNSQPSGVNPQVFKICLSISL